MSNPFVGHSCLIMSNTSTPPSLQHAFVHFFLSNLTLLHRFSTFESFQIEVIKKQPWHQSGGAGHWDPEDLAEQPHEGQAWCPGDPYPLDGVWDGSGESVEQINAKTQKILSVRDWQGLARRVRRGRCLGMLVTSHLTKCPYTVKRGASCLPGLLWMVRAEDTVLGWKENRTKAQNQTYCGRFQIFVSLNLVTLLK